MRVERASKEDGRSVLRFCVASPFPSLSAYVYLDIGKKGFQMLIMPCIIIVFLVDMPILKPSYRPCHPLDHRPQHVSRPIVGLIRPPVQSYAWTSVPSILLLNVMPPATREEESIARFDANGEGRGMRSE
jgi:hypothetical protein